MIKVTPNPEGFRRMRSKFDGLTFRTGDFRGPVLRLLGQVHRRQEKRIFSSEGSAGAGGAWAALSPPYAAKKKKLFPRRKILVLSGETRRRFTVVSDPNYIQRYRSLTDATGVFSFGASSDIAAAHYHGNPGLAPLPTGVRLKIFGGIARQLPVRDMITKTAEQMQEFRTAFKEFYIKRAKQVARGITSLRGRG